MKNEDVIDNLGPVLTDAFSFENANILFVNWQLNVYAPKFK